MFIKYIKNTKIRKILSVSLNFVCALVVGFTLFIVSGAFMLVDSRTKNVAGNFDSQLFSYNITDENIAEITALGEKFDLDLNQIIAVKTKFDEFSRINDSYTPQIFVMMSEIVNSCIESAGGSFSKIPEIITYWSSKAEKPKEIKQVT